MGTIEQRASALEKEFATLKSDVETVVGNTSALEKEFVALRAYLVAAAAVLTIFGIAGAWGFSILSAAKTELETAQANVKALSLNVVQERGRLDEISKLINPKQIEAVIRDKIDTIAPVSVGALARKELARAVDVSPASATEGCMKLDDSKLQVCWGTQELQPQNHTRSFDIKFARPFASAPVVVPGINTTSDGHAPAIWQFTITESRYHGSVNNMHKPDAYLPGQVFLNYLAIGASSR